MPTIIEILTFPNHEAITGTFVPFLRSYFCGSSSALTDTYIDGGTWAIYAGDDATTAKVGTAMAIQPTKLC